MKMKNERANRKLKISILRFNPREPGSVPRMVTYELDEAENMTLFIALSEIREKQEPSLEFDFVCCVAGCGTARMRENFVGAVGLNKIARFRIDPRDRRGDEDYFELIGDDDGVFGCMSLLACHDVCPKNLPLATQIAFLRRKMVAVGWK